MKLCNFKIAQNTRLSNPETVEIHLNHFHHHHTRVSPAILSPYLATIARESASTSPAGMNFPELTNLWKNSDYLRGILDFARQFDPNWGGQKVHKAKSKANVRISDPPWIEVTAILCDLPVSHEGGETGRDQEREDVVVRVHRRLSDDAHKFSLQLFSDYLTKNVNCSALLRMTRLGAINTDMSRCQIIRLTLFDDLIGAPKIVIFI